MTAEELIDDLARLLREGLVYVYEGDDTPPRFAVTARGRDLSTAAHDRPLVDAHEEGTAR